MSRWGTREQKAARDARVAQLRLDGLSQAEIAVEVGLTPQTVHRILRARTDLPDPRPMMAARQRAITAAKQEAAKARIAEHLAATTGLLRAGELAAAAGITVSEMRAFITPEQRERLVPHEPGPARRRLQEVSDEVLLDFARTLAVKGPVLTARWDSERDRRTIPSAGGVASRFGGWQRFLDAAGVAPTVNTPAGAVRWTDEAMLDAVATFLARPHGDGFDSTLDQWMSYAHGNPMAPGVVTLRDRIGGWNEVKSRAWAHRKKKLAAQKRRAARLRKQAGF